MSEREPAQESPPLWVGFLILLGVLTLGNFYVVPHLGSGTPAVLLIVAWIGVMPAQVALVAMVGVLTPISAPLRVLITLGLGVVLIGALAAGAVVSAAGNEIHEASLGALFGAILTVPTTVASAQIPIWLARVFFGWQICHVTRTDSLVKPSQFSIANLLLVTAVVAVLLALDQQTGRLLGAQPFYLWTQVAIQSAVAAILCAATVLPALYAILRMRHAGTGFGAMLAYAAGVSLLLIMLSVLFSGLPPYPEVIFGIGGIIFAYVFALLIPLAIARGNGYRLVTGNPSPNELSKFFEHDSPVRTSDDS